MSSEPLFDDQTPPALSPEGEQVVLLNPKVTGKPQRIRCPFCRCMVKAQFLESQGVMTGWNDCMHVYAATDDSETVPGLVFRRTAPALLGGR